MIQAAKIQREMLKGMAGSTLPDHREKASKLTAVNVSTPYTAIEIKRNTHKKKYENGVQQDSDLKSSKF